MYRPDKITQTAAYILKKANNKLPYIVLMKLLYYADKEMLLLYGEPITFDDWYSMKKGPVLSHTLNLIRMPDETASDYWSSHMETRGNDLFLTSDPGDDLLSELEEEVIDKIYEQYGDPTGVYNEAFKWNLVEKTHDLPEWDKTTLNGGSSPIPYEKVLMLAGVSSEGIREIIGNIRSAELLGYYAEASRRDAEAGRGV